jgi:F-type H+-transporting ATPase subunit b
MNFIIKKIDNYFMLHFSLPNFNINDNISGQLFDFNLTLFFVIFQFLLLMLTLNLILYKPLLFIMDQRNEYINNILKKVKEINFKINQVNDLYENKLKIIQKKAKLDIERVQNIYIRMFRIELDIFNKNIGKLFNNVTNDLLTKKNVTLKKLDPVIQKLSHEIETRLLV